MYRAKSTLRVAYVTLYAENWRLPSITRGDEPIPEYLYFQNKSRFDVTVESLAGTDAETPAKRYALLHRLKTDGCELAANLDLSGYDCVVAAAESVGDVLAGKVTKPLLVCCHGFPSQGLLRKKLFYGEKPIHFLFLSRSLRKNMCALHGIPHERSHLLGHSVDTEFFKPDDQQSPDDGLVVAAGTGNRDYPTLVQACSELPLRLVIAADSAWFPHPHGLSMLDLPPNIRVGSARSYSILRELYRSALFVVTPLQNAPNACGYSVIGEAMAMGKAVIATRTQAPSDFITQMHSGIYVLPNSHDALRAAIKYLLDDPLRAKEMGRQARERFSQFFGHTAFVRRLDEIILEVVTRL